MLEFDFYEENPEEDTVEDTVEEEMQQTYVDANASPVPIVQISLCREQYRENMKEKELQAIIMNNRVSYSELFENPSLLEHPSVSFTHECMIV